MRKYSISKRDIVELISVTAILLVILLLPTILSIILHTNVPLAHIISGSMQPTYYQGDLVIIAGVPPDKITVGDVIVFRNPNNPSEIILHRVFYIKVVNGTRFFLTKGDNPYTNPYPDSWGWVHEKYLIGKVIFRIPLLGLILEVLGNFIIRFLLIVTLSLLLLREFTAKEKSYYTGHHIKRPKILCRKSFLGGFIILVLFFTILYASVNYGIGDITVSISKPTLYEYKAGKVLIVPLHVKSLKLGIISIREIRISLVNPSLGTLLARTVWKIPYNFHGEKFVSVALFLGENCSLDSKMRYDIILEILIYDLFGSLVAWKFRTFTVIITGSYLPDLIL